MIFKEITINNYRGIKSVEIKNLSRFNLFVGKNNSGKSSILESIFIMLSPSNPGSIVSMDNIRNLLHTDESDFRFPFYDLNFDNTIEIKSVLHDNNSIRNLKVVPLKHTYLTQFTADAAPKQSDSLTTTVQGAGTIDSTPNDFINGLEFQVEIKKGVSPNPS